MYKKTAIILAIVLMASQFVGATKASTAAEQAAEKLEARQCQLDQAIDPAHSCEHLNQL